MKKIVQERYSINPHIVDEFFCHRVKEFVNAFFGKDGLECEYVWYRFEFQKRGNIHVHGVVKLKSDPGLPKLSQLVIDGRKAAQILRIAKNLGSGNLIDVFPSDDVIAPSEGDSLLSSGEDELRIKLLNRMLHEDEVLILVKDIDKGKGAETILTMYRDDFVSTFHPQPPNDANLEVRDEQHLPPFGRHACSLLHLNSNGSVGLRPEMYDQLLDQCQRHRHHPTYCLQNGKCRFSFPRTIQPETRIIVKEIPYKRDPTKLRRTSVEFVSKCNDRWINSHNPIGLLAWGGNMDCTLLIDPLAVVEYVCKYCTKSEKSSSAFSSIVNAAYKKRQDQCDLETSKVLRTIFNMQIRRDKCTQEIARLAASRPIVHCSHTFVVVNLTSQIRKLNIKSEDADSLAVLDNIYDLYLKRFLNSSWTNPLDIPSTSDLTTVSLYTFVSNFTKTLRNDQYKIVKRSASYNTVPIFSPEFSSNPCSRSYWCYCYIALLKYKPHSEPILDFERFNMDNIETSDISESDKQSIILNWTTYLSTCIDSTSANHGLGNQVPDNIIREFHKTRTELDEIDPIFQSLSSDYSMDMEDIQSNAVHKQYYDDEVEINIPIDSNKDWTCPSNQYAESEFQKTFVDDNIRDKIVSISNSIPIQKEDDIDITKCNSQQQDALYVWKTICINCGNNRITSSEYSDNAIIINGWAGAGKSFLIEAMIQTCQSITGNASKKVLVLAPTGKAAVAAGGFTLHSSFGLLLPADPKRRSTYTPLSNKQLLVMQSRFDCISALIIDEYSMISLVDLLYIDKRLRQILCSDLPFGGIPISFIGDPGQLPPVAAPCLWATKDSKGRSFKSSLRREGSQLYQKIRNVMKLTNVIRQSDKQEVDFLLAWL